MFEQNRNSSSWFKPWWKGLLVVAFFPITLSYYIWKQSWKTPVKLGAIALLWIVFIGLGSDNSSETTSFDASQPTAEAEASPTPAPTITLEQKQSDFKTFYTNYQQQAQAVILVQASLSQLAGVSGSREELYLALDKLSNIQNNLSGNDVEVPDSLKEHKELGSAAFEVRLAASHFKNAIEAMKDYVNKNDLEELKSAQLKQQLGEENLTSSMDKVEKVAQELSIDLDALKAELRQE